MRYVFYMRVCAYSIHPHIVLFVCIITTDVFLLPASQVIYKLLGDIKTQSDHSDTITEKNSKWLSMIGLAEKEQERDHVQNNNSVFCDVHEMSNILLFISARGVMHTERRQHREMDWKNISLYSSINSLVYDE